MTLMVIHTNAPVNQPIYALDRNGGALEIDTGSTFKCSIKNKKADASPILTFISGGGSGMGTISIITDLIEGETRDLWLLTAEQALVDGIEPGAYYADLLQIDDPAWKFGFDVIVDAGIT